MQELFANYLGTPTTEGTFNFTIQAADINGCTGTQAYAVTITGGATGTGLQFYPLAAPVRLLDTRAGATGCFTPGAKIPGNTSRMQSVAGFCAIPATARAVTGNITTVQSGGGYLVVPEKVAPQTAAKRPLKGCEPVRSLNTSPESQFCRT